MKYSGLVLVPITTKLRGPKAGPKMKTKTDFKIGPQIKTPKRNPGRQLCQRHRQGSLHMIFNHWSAQRSYSIVLQQTKNFNPRKKRKLRPTNLLKPRACIRLQAKYKDMIPLQKIHSAISRMGNPTACLL
jgi:hypothetical protein